MKQTFWNKRIPTLLGIFLIVIGVGVTSYLTSIGVNPFIKAAPQEAPIDMRITNISDTAFTVTYSTQGSVIGSISVGKDSSLGQIFLDDRDQASGTPTFHKVHSITARGLQPNTTYFFSITSGTTTYTTTANNTNQPFTVTTGPAISTPPSDTEPVSGKILLPDGSVPDEALVYVTVENGQTLSTLEKPSGLYVIPLNTMRNSDLSSYITIDPSAPMQLLITSPDGSSRAVLATDKRNPVPTITLTNDYDFSLNITPLASSSALPEGFPSFALNTATIIEEPKIQTPTNGENFSDPQPLLKGQALPGEDVNITIHSQEQIQATVTADSNGNWTYRPTQPLSPGEHTITIQTKDQYGIMQTIQQTFTVLQSGVGVAEAATPSATLTPTKSPTVTPTIGITSVPTITTAPTQTIVSPTVPLPTTKLQTTVVPTKKPGAVMPATGNDSAVIIGITGMVTTLFGFGLFFLTRGAAAP